MKLLALEISTTSSKAQFLDTDNCAKSVLSERHQRGATIEDLCQQVLRLGRQVCAQHSIDTIAIAGTWHSLVICDNTMNPLFPLMDWTDISDQNFCEALRSDDAYVEAFYQASGAMVNALYPYFKLLRLHRDGVLNEAHCACSLGSFLHYRITGSWKETACMLSGMALCSVHEEQLHSMAMALPCRFAPLVGWNDVSRLSEQGASILGLNEGVPVLPAQPDGALNQIGSEAESGSVLTLSLGTSGALRLASPTPWLSPSRSTWLYRSPTAYLVGAATSGCTNCLDWYKEQAFGNRVSYQHIESNLKVDTQVPMFLPFLVGERCPNWQDTRRASFHDVGPTTTKEDLYLAVLQGVLANLFQCYEKLGESNLPISCIRVSGGVLNSALWKQMCCDYFGHPMEEDTHQHASLYGALVLAARSQRIDLFAQQNRKRSLLIPSSVLHEQYQAHYQRYLDWYKKTAH
ncbi:MAG: hypothetical protein EOM68_11965 [Spirochaetia bacterium]|nr:hypothetical protein [Spirochaetia bacterium]